MSKAPQQKAQTVTPVIVNPTNETADGFYNFEAVAEPATVYDEDIPF